MIHAMVSTLQVVFDNGDATCCEEAVRFLEIAADTSQALHNAVRDLALELFDKTTNKEQIGGIEALLEKTGAGAVARRESGEIAETPE